MGRGLGLHASAEADCSGLDRIALAVFPTGPATESKCQMEWYRGHGDGIAAQSVRERN